MTLVNPVENSTALLRPNMPGVYPRNMIYDPTWDHPSYSDYNDQRIIPAVNSIVKDPDGSALWVTAIAPVTFIPSYQSIPLATENENIVSILNYGNTIFRLYVDYRGTPYPASPDSKCIFLGRTPRYYTLSRYPRTSQETIVSQYYTSDGQLSSNLVPLRALDENNSSWYLPRCHINQILDDDEEIEVKIYNEDGAQVHSAIMFTKSSAIINEALTYTPNIVGMTVTGTQKLANGNLFLYEKQNFDALGLQVTVSYDDGTSRIVPIDGQKCILYGRSDFISSFSGLSQNLTVKYFRSENEGLSQSISDVTGSMITVTVPVTVIANTLGTTVKIMPMPYYNSGQARYSIKYIMYFGDGRGSIDVTAYVTLTGTLNTTSSHFGIAQTFTVSLDMKQIDPVSYPVTTVYQQSMVVTLNVPNQVVKYTIRDSATSPQIYGLDNSAFRRPSLKWDSTLEKMFVPSYIFGNQAAFLNSFYTKASPPYDPVISEIPQTPTHFVIRNVVTNAMIISSPIPVGEYPSAFNILNSTPGQYVGATVIVEFINRISSTVQRTLFGVPVDVTVGTHVS